MKFVKMIAILVVALGMAACGGISQRAAGYDTQYGQMSHKVVYGVVIDVRAVEIELPSTGTGVATGAVIGGLVFGANNRHVAGILGALAGGLTGSAAEKFAQTKSAQEIIFRVDGTAVDQALVQQEDGHSLKAGDRIRIIDSGKVKRITKA